MSNNRSKQLGEDSIPSLLIKQAVPASIGILVMSIYGIVDTIFVGRFIGPLAIGATTVVFPITLLIGSVGMAIGIGGASMISRALGADDTKKARLTFGNQIVLTVVIAVAIMLISYQFMDEVLLLFGAKGDLLPLSRAYFKVIILGVPFLAWAMMSNNIIRSEGRATVAMFVMMIPAVMNIILDPIFIIVLDMGIEGAAWATTIAYICSAAFALIYFATGKSELKFKSENLILKWPIVAEIFSIGGVTFARQGTIGLLFIVLNNTLFTYGGELAISTYGIINRIMMMTNFPVLGVTQGFLPIAGYNYGAKKWQRVEQTIKTAILSGSAIAFLMFLGVMFFTYQLVSMFTEDSSLLGDAPNAIRIAFIATPLLCLQLIGAAYYQAIGKALPALLLTLTKQGFCLIPLILILPNFMGIYGVWASFPIADTLSAIISFIFLRKGIAKLQTAKQTIPEESLVVETR